MKKLIIIIDNGDVFEGSLEQFRDCFFSNASIKTIKEWCKDLNMKVKFKYEKIKG